MAINTAYIFKNTVKLAYNNIRVWDTLSIASDILWCQLIAHG